MSFVVHTMSKLVATGFILAASSVASSQVAGIAVSPGTQISVDNNRTPHFETFVAVNPKNSNQLLATSITMSRGQKECVAYRSEDGGRTWQRIINVPNEEKLRDAGDPVVYFDEKGTGFWATTSHPGLPVARSPDGGRRWAATLLAAEIPSDREWLAIDRSQTSPYAGRIYAVVGPSVAGRSVSGTRLLAVFTSTDGGSSFLQESILIMKPTASAGWMGEPVVAANGELIIPVVSAVSDNPGLGQLGLWISIDGGRTFTLRSNGPRIPPDRSGYKFAKSLSTMRSAVDLSVGPHRGRIYLFWTEPVGMRADKRLAYTDDLGLTWSDPRTVNDNPDNSEPGNGGLAVNKDGVVGVAWNDYRDDPARDCFQFYFAASGDGGSTFSPGVKVGRNPVCPKMRENNAATAYSLLSASAGTTSDLDRPSLRRIGMVTVASRWPNGGDTLGLIAGEDGTFHTAWINSVNDVMQLWYSQIRVDKDVLSLSQNSSSLSSNTSTRTTGDKPISSESSQKITEDLTKLIEFRFQSPVFDLAAHSISVGVELFNPTQETYRGPFTIVLDELPETYFPGIHAANADNGQSGKGATWKFSTPVLNPGAKSELKTLRWTYTGDVDPTTFFVGVRILRK